MSAQSDYISCESKISPHPCGGGGSSSPHRRHSEQRLEP